MPQLPQRLGFDLAAFLLSDNFKEFFDSTPGLPVAHAQHMPKKGPVSERHVRVFRNGRNQAVRIPREFELPVQEAIMRNEGHRLIIEPAPAKSLRVVLGGLKSLREKFPRISDLRADSVDL